MRTIKSIQALRLAAAGFRRKGRRVGFVPTMGYLHEGHLALVRQAQKECDICVVSIYVNPKQFGPQEDLARYPRDLQRDTTLLKKENVDILFLPSDNVLYPSSYLTYIDVTKISETLCGAFRPGHFQGVATIVAKFLNIVQPDVMYLGQKDAQQVAVLKTMVKDLDFPVQVQVVPTVREQDGLAMSSRNAYLSPEQRKQAMVLPRALAEAQKVIKAGEQSASRIIRVIETRINQGSDGKIEYVACVDAYTLKPLQMLKGKVLIALAVFFGSTRLIDNVIVSIKDSRKVKN